MEVSSFSKISKIVLNFEGIDLYMLEVKFCLFWAISIPFQVCEEVKNNAEVSYQLPPYLYWVISKKLYTKTSGLSGFDWDFVN